MKLLNVKLVRIHVIQYNFYDTLISSENLENQFSFISI